MKINGEVVSLEKIQNILGDDGIRVVMKLYGVGTFTVELKPHKAKPYFLGRKVAMELSLVK